MLKCLICNFSFKHLGSHLWQRHKMLSRDYKTKFGLDIKHALITDEIKEKKRIALERSPTWKVNFKNSEQYQFKKGVRNRWYFSEESKKRYAEQSKQLLNHREHCPVCNIIFNNIASHLREKHGLKRI